MQLPAPEAQGVGPALPGAPAPDAGAAYGFEAADMTLFAIQPGRIHKKPPGQVTELG